MLEISGSHGKVRYLTQGSAATKSHHLNLVFETHKVEAENAFLQTALYLYTFNMSSVFLTYTAIPSKLNKIMKT